jgi:hydroxymethylbilane synthase
VGVPERADPHDALCGAASLEALPAGAVVGTASVRRQAQLLALRDDLEVRELRGNVDTRLRRLAAGDFDAIVLARAGLERLGRAGEGEALPALVPAPGQGCLALEARSDDAGTAAAAARLTDRPALTALTAERALVTALGATCHTPIGAHAEERADQLALRAFVGLPDGSHWIRDELDGDAADPAALGRAVAERLEVAGARRLLDEAERAALDVR